MFINLKRNSYRHYTGNHETYGIQDGGMIGELFAAYKGKVGVFFLIEGYHSGFAVIHSLRRLSITYDTVQSSVLRDKYYNIPNNFNINDYDDVKNEFIRICENYIPHQHSQKFKVRDNQRNRVYEWEKSLINNHQNTKMTAEQITQLIAKVCTDYNLREPGIKFKKNDRGHSCAIGGHRVEFIASQYDIMTTLHEMAHIYIQQNKKPLNKFAGHGPEYVNIYMNFLERYHNMNMTFMQQVARTHGVQYQF